MKPCGAVDIEEFSKYPIANCLDAVTAHLWYALMKEEEDIQSTVCNSIYSVTSDGSFMDREKRQDVINEHKNARMMLLAGATALAEHCPFEMELPAGYVAVTYDGQNPSKIEPHAQQPNGQSVGVFV